MNNQIKILKNVAPFITVFFLPLITLNEAFLTFVIIVLILISLKINYTKDEWKLVIIGILIGFIVEVVTGMFYRIQFWANGSLFGVPTYVPFLWGYGFLIIRRIGNIIIKA